MGWLRRVEDGCHTRVHTHVSAESPRTARAQLVLVTYFYYQADWEELGALCFGTLKHTQGINPLQVSGIPQKERTKMGLCLG
jgi:hypothetical protein